MKINIQKLVRVIAPIVSVFAVLILCVMPASAAGLDYNDYITSIRVDGDNDIVTVTFPFDKTQFRLFEYHGDFVQAIYGSSGTFSVNADVPYLLRIYPTTRFISLDNIPQGTEVSLSMSIDNTSWGFIDITKAFTQFNYACLDRSGGFISSVWQVSDRDLLSDVNATFTLEPLPNSAAFEVFCDYGNFSFSESRDVQIAIDSFSMTMTISSLYRLQQQTGKTNEILTEVGKQLAEQGKTLDEVLGAQKETNEKLDNIINGSSEQQNAADKFKDDIGSASDSLDAVGDALNQVPKPNISAGSLVPNDVLSGNDYLVYVASIQEFWKSEILSAVTLILGSMILISYVLFGEKG